MGLKLFGFLKPRLSNLILTFIILNLPLLREVYYTGEYVTWHRPIVLIIGYLQSSRPAQFLPIILEFISLAYILASLVTVAISKFIGSLHTPGV